MEGNQAVLILLKLLSILLNKISHAIEKLASMYLKNRQRKRELGLKKGKIIKADKIELMIAKQLRKRLIDREKNLEEKVRTSKYKLDCYKLERQSELSDFEKNIRKLQGSLEVAKDIDKKMLQKELYKTIKEKEDFEKEVNKNLLKINHKNNILENEYKKLLENIKICDKSIDGFASDRAKDMTVSMRNQFESLVKDESLSYSQDKNLDVNLTPKSKDDIDINSNIENKHEVNDKSLKLNSSPDTKYIGSNDPILLNPPSNKNFLELNIFPKINPSPGSMINTDLQNTINKNNEHLEYKEKEDITPPFNEQKIDIKQVKLDTNKQPVYNHIENVEVESPKKDYKYENLNDMHEDDMLSYLRTAYFEENMSDPESVRAVNAKYGLREDYGLEESLDKQKIDKSGDINKEDKFMEEYYEKQRRKSLAQERQKDQDISR